MMSRGQPLPLLDVSIGVTWGSAANVKSIQAMAGLSVHVVDLSEVRSKDDLLQSLSQVLEFPPYFAPNWDSFEECLAGLAASHGPTKLVVVFRPIEQLFALQDAATILFRVLHDVACEWQKLDNGSTLAVMLQGIADRKSRELLRSAGLQSVE